MLHWNYFLALENDIERLSRYIEFDRKNSKTFSVELSHLLLSISSEVDVTLKLLCNELDPAKKPRTINDYRQIITTHQKKFLTEPVFIPRYNLKFTPWEKWNDNENPGWWTSYNNVKHQRNINYGQANLWNVLKAISGLFVTIFYLKEVEQYGMNPLYQEAPINKLIPRSTLFRLDQKHYYFASMNA